MESESELMKRTVPELKDLCTAHGLPTSGA